MFRIYNPAQCFISSQLNNELEVHIGLLCLVKVLVRIAHVASVAGGPDSSSKSVSPVKHHMAYQRQTTSWMANVAPEASGGN